MFICDFCKKEMKRDELSEMFRHSEGGLYDVCLPCDEEFTEIMSIKRNEQRQELVELRTDFIEQKTKE